MFKFIVRYYLLFSMVGSDQTDWKDLCLCLRTPRIFVKWEESLILSKQNIDFNLQVICDFKRTQARYKRKVVMLFLLENKH